MEFSNWIKELNQTNCNCVEFLTLIFLRLFYKNIDSKDIFVRVIKMLSLLFILDHLSVADYVKRLNATLEIIPLLRF